MDFKISMVTNKVAYRLSYNQDILVFDWISLRSLGKVVKANSGLIKTINLRKKHRPTTIYFVTFRKPGTLRSSLYTEVKNLFCFWQHLHWFKYAATFLNILCQKSVLQLFYTWAFFQVVMIRQYFHEYHGLYSFTTLFLPQQFGQFCTLIDCLLI